MTPYVHMQQRIIDMLFRLKDYEQDKLLVLTERCRSEEQTDWPQYLHNFGLYIPREDWHSVCDFPKIILEQIDDEGEEVIIRNLLGTPFEFDIYDETYGLDGWVKNRGNGQNFLRTSRYAQPRALKEGDTLITGERVISPPRDGGNGAVLIHLSGHCRRGDWLSFPSRSALAHIGCIEAEIPLRLVKG